MYHIMKESWKNIKKVINLCRDKITGVRLNFTQILDIDLHFYVTEYRANQGYVGISLK